MTPRPMASADMPADLLDFGQELLRKIERGIHDQLEIFLSRNTITTAEIEKGSLKKSERLFDMGFSVRAIKDKSIGFAHSSSLEKNDVQEVIDEAVTLTKVMTPDPEFHSLPEAESYPKVVKKPDRRIYSAEVEDVVDMVAQVMDSARIDQRIYSINASVDLASIEVAIVNSLGVSASDNDTFAGASASVVSKNENEMASGFEFQEARTIKEIDPLFVGREAAKQSIKQLGAKKTESGEHPVVFGPKVTAGIISSGVAAACNAENIQKKRSYLTGKFGETIGNSEITVIDDGTLPNGIATSRFDAEGAPRTSTKIIERGVLKSSLHDSYTAKKEGVKNTGNAVRGGGWDYKVVPSIGQSNLVITPVKGDLDSLVSEVDEGILLLYTGDRPNLATGEFSAQVTVGFKIEKGDLTHPLKQASVGSNLIDMFKNMDAIGRDTRQIGGVIAPSTRVSKAMISGGS
jgi:PmbA protein